MAHIEVEASVRTHKKFLKAGPDASWLWLCGMGYCQDGLTDGFIPAEAIDFLGVKAELARELAAVLVRERLWEEADGGWRVHDYLKHNRSAESIANIRATRAAGGRKGGRPVVEPSSETLEVTEKVTHVVNPSHLISSQLSSEVCDEPPSDSSPAVLTFVTARKGQSWTLTEARLEAWRSAYPNLDVLGECRRAQAWLEANQAKRKTPKGMPAFFVRWFTNATDRPRPHAVPQASGGGVIVPDVAETRRRYLS